MITMLMEQNVLLMELLKQYTRKIINQENVSEKKIKN